MGSVADQIALSILRISDVDTDTRIPAFIKNNNKKKKKKKNTIRP